VFPVPWSSKWSWSLHLFFGRPMFLRPFGLYCNACFGILFLSILCTCCSHFFWYCFISFTMFCAPVFSLIHWLFSLSNFIIPSKCLKNFICAAYKRCSSLFFSTQASLPNFNTAFILKPEILHYLALTCCQIGQFPKSKNPHAWYENGAKQWKVSLQCIITSRNKLHLVNTHAFFSSLLYTKR